VILKNERNYFFFWTLYCHKKAHWLLRIGWTPIIVTVFIRL